MAETNLESVRKIGVAAGIVILLVLAIIGGCSDYLLKSDVATVKSDVAEIKVALFGEDGESGFVKTVDNIHDIVYSELKTQIERADKAESLAADYLADKKLAEQEASRLGSELAKVQSDYGALKEQSESTEKELSSLEEELSETRRQLNAALVAKDRLQVVTEERDSLKIQISVSEQTIINLQEKLEESGQDEQSVSELSEIISDIREELAVAKEELISVNAEIKELILLIGSKDELEKKVFEKQAEYDVLQAEYDALEEAIAEKQAEYDVLQAEYDVLQAEYDALEEAIAKKQAEYDAIPQGGNGTGTQVAVIPEAPTNLRLEMSKDMLSAELKWNHPGADYFRILSRDNRNLPVNEVPKDDADLDHIGMTYKRSIDAIESALDLETEIQIIAVKNGVESNPSPWFKIKAEDIHPNPELTVSVDGRPFAGNTISVRGTVATVSLTGVKYGTEYRIGTSFYELNRAEWKPVTFLISEHVSFQNLNDGDEDLYVEVRNQYGETRVEIPIRIQ